jgi:hypothetical protein
MSTRVYGRQNDDIIKTIREDADVAVLRTIFDQGAPVPGKRIRRYYTVSRASFVTFGSIEAKGSERTTNVVFP